MYFKNAVSELESFYASGLDEKNNNVLSVVNDKIQEFSNNTVSKVSEKIKEIANNTINDVKEERKNNSVNIVEEENNVIEEENNVIEEENNVIEVVYDTSPTEVAEEACECLQLKKENKKAFRECNAKTRERVIANRSNPEWMQEWRSELLRVLKDCKK